ncbi:PP0621 family protein [Collimonas silvisoli]|uniref:PP0621 family protein n=1 Tax=Collimonas silvisoli TaxID=2825884 RepID=UPI001B8CC8AE|nr:PP0621 family protein [Collimonas silvisoli]
MKLIILIVVVLAVIVWLQRLKKSLGGDRSTSGGSTFAKGTAASESPQAEAMVACAHCGMHFPASEALADASGAVFCSAEHRRLHSS